MLLDSGTLLISINLFIYISNNKSASCFFSPNNFANKYLTKCLLQLIYYSNLLEKTTDDVIKAAKIGDLVMVGFENKYFILFQIKTAILILCSVKRLAFARLFVAID